MFCSKANPLAWHANPHRKKAGLLCKKADPLFPKASLPRIKADPHRKKTSPLRGDAGCISLLVPRQWPLVPKLQLGHALVCEALLRPRRKSAHASLHATHREAELPGHWHSQAGAWERGARGAKKDLTDCRSYGESSPVQSWWFSLVLMCSHTSSPSRFPSAPSRRSRLCRFRAASVFSSALSFAPACSRLFPPAPMNPSHPQP